MELLIRRLGREDTAIARDNCSLFWDTVETDKALESFLAGPNNVMMVAELNGEQAGQVLGYLLKRWDLKQPMLFLYSIDVAEQFRRKGVGKRLIQEFLAEGRGLGCEECFVLTSASNSAAMRLYESAGGTRTSSDDVMFEWDLKGE